MKKYTYKREAFLNFKSDKARVIFGLIWVTIMLYCFLSCLFRGNLLEMALSVIIAIPALIILRMGYKKGKKDYNEWQQTRTSMMQNGIKMIGNIVGSGGHRYVKQNEYIEHSEDRNRRKSYSTIESDWWIEVEYVDTRDGETKRFKAQNMNANGKRLIGTRADVYIYNNSIYIDIP